MIVAIEGLIPDRRLTPHPAAPVPSPIPRPNIYTPEWLRERQRQAAKKPRQPIHRQSIQGMLPRSNLANPSPSRLTPPSKLSVNCRTTQAIQRPRHPPAQSKASPPCTNPIVDPERNNWVPAATGNTLDLFLDREASRRLPFSPGKAPAPAALMAKNIEFYRNNPQIVRSQF